LLLLPSLFRTGDAFSDASLSLTHLIRAHFPCCKFSFTTPKQHCHQLSVGGAPKQRMVTASTLPPNSGDETEHRVMLSAKLDEATLTGNNQAAQ
jgi:hypothetical protein